MKIEKGIPIPPSNQKKGKWAEVLLAMGHGDSILVEKSATVTTLRSALKTLQKSGDIAEAVTLVARLVENGVRVWFIDRMADEGKDSK